MITFNPKLLAAVAVAQSTEETRPYICGVFFTGTVAVATDGHFFTIANGGTDNADPDRVIRHISKKAVVALKSQKSFHAQIDNEVLTVINNRGATSHMEECPALDFTYPDWRRVVPETRGNPTTAIFSQIVHRQICDTAKILSATSFVFYGEDKGSAHVISYDDREDVFSVAMPFRGTLLPRHPNWFAQCS